MPSFRNNCYGFVYAGLQNSEEEYFKNIDDLNLKNVELKGKIDKEIIITTDAIKETFALSNKTKEWKILQLFDHEKRSQHVAFIDVLWRFYDQNGPDGEIRLGGNLDDLLYQYQSLFWTAYYQVHPLDFNQEQMVSNFIESLS